jgi:hypothetical protein
MRDSTFHYEFVYGNYDVIDFDLAYSSRKARPYVSVLNFSFLVEIGRNNSKQVEIRPAAKKKYGSRREPNLH